MLTSEIKSWDDFGFIIYFFQIVTSIYYVLSYFKVIRDIFSNFSKITEYKVYKYVFF